jgi:dCMP deaminase
MDSIEIKTSTMTSPYVETRPPWNNTFMRIVEVLSERSSCIKYKTACIIVKGTQIIAMGYNGTLNRCEECCDYWFRWWNEHKKNSNVDSNSTNNINDYCTWIKCDEFKNMHRSWSLKSEIHAEINALNWISKRDVDDTCILYTLYSPCDKCTTQIISYGIKKVYYKYEYPNGAEARINLSNHGVCCRMI